MITDDDLDLTEMDLEQIRAAVSDAIMGHLHGGPDRDPSVSEPPPAIGRPMTSVIRGGVGRGMRKVVSKE